MQRRMHAYAVMIIFGIGRITAFIRRSISTNLLFSPPIFALFFFSSLVPFGICLRDGVGNFQSKKV